jgi:hypothetical protein
VCKRGLEDNVTPRNVLDILEAADRIQAHEMKEHALAMIVHMFPQVHSGPKRIACCHTHGPTAQVASQDKLQALSKPLLLCILGALAKHMQQRGTDV